MINYMCTNNPVLIRRLLKDIFEKYLECWNVLFKWQLSVEWTKDRLYFWMERMSKHDTACGCIGSMYTEIIFFIASSTQIHI